MLLDLILIIIGLAILIGGAETMVRGAASLALKLRISPLVIGLTVVSFGTSAPELIVNIYAALDGAPDLAIGNVIGSNLANILLVLGVSAIIIPLTVKSSTVWKEIPFALLGAVLLFLIANDVLFNDGSVNIISRTEGMALLAIMLIFFHYVFGVAKKDQARPKHKIESQSNGIHKYSISLSLFMTIVGVVGLVIGGRLLVDNSVDIAKSAGLSEALIGITIIGIGTSLPELATSVVAALKRQTDLAIGNIIGSNIFNVFWIIGLTATIAPIPYNTVLNPDAILVIIATLLLFAFMFFGKKRHQLERWEGGVFLAIYISYLVYLALRG